MTADGRQLRGWPVRPHPRRRALQRPRRARGPARRALAPERRGRGELAALQAELVTHARTLLAPGGELHFAVCTLNPQENEDVAPAAGLTAHDELRTWPDEGDDGFYAARLA